MIKKIINICILIIITFTFFYIGYARYINKEKVIKIFDYGILIVLSGSMNPTIQKYELILIKEQKDYKLSDIVTYLNEDDILITHRIVEIDNEKFIALGDNNNISDIPISQKNIEGKVIYHSKILGTFVMFYLKPVILAYICIVMFLDVKREIMKEEKVE